MLHVTSGESAADSIRRAELGGVVLPWHDILHEGPVRMGLAPAPLRGERAAFLARLTGGDAARIERMLAHRDDILANFDLHEEVVLWFDADLFDQLQLLQVLDRFAAAERGPVGLTLVDSEPASPGRQRPPGLSELEPHQIARLFAKRALVGEDQIELSAFAWQAFRAPEPVFIERLRGMDLAALPHLSDALGRHLEQFPSVRNGLGRTERVIVGALRDGARRQSALFRVQAAQEERPFLGRSVFAWYLSGLAAGTCPAIVIESDPAGEESVVRLTEDGERYRVGAGDFIADNGIDRWWGGVHQQGHHVRWRWDEETRNLRSLAPLPPP